MSAPILLEARQLIQAFQRQFQKLLPIVLACLACVTAGTASAQTTFNFTGAVQTYTIPAGAGGVQIQAAGAGGGSGGNDLNGLGGAGGAGARATGVYLAASGTVLNIYVGQGGQDANTSQSPYSCPSGGGLSAIGAGGLAGGATGFAGGSGGNPGCGGYSGGGAGGGAASVVATAVNARLVVAGGGGGGQGGAWDTPGRVGLSATATGALPGSAGAAGTTSVADGAGGGGGGGGCPGGAGGAILADQSGANNTAQAVGGSSCRDATQVTGFAVNGAAGGAGGVSAAGVPTNGNPGGNGSVTITPLYPTLNLAKSQPSPTLAMGGNSTYTLTVTNTSTTPGAAARVLDQLPANLTFVSSSGTGWSCGTAANAGGTLVTCDFSGTIAASGGTTTLQITVTATNNLGVTNYASVDAAGGTAPPNPASCTGLNTPSAGCAAPVSSAAATQISGNVYLDANHNGSLDGIETGAGVSGLYVKLVPASGSNCTGPALAAAPVTAATGAYSLTNVAQGSYCLVLDANNNLADIAPAVPAGFIPTQNASLIIRLAVGGAPPAPQNFGLYKGAALSGVVFGDTGAGAGTANNGIKDGGEAGLAGVTVNAQQGASVVASAGTAGDGSYTLWLPAGTGAVSISPGAPSAYVATGGSPGTSAGVYTRPSVNSVTPVAGQSYSGVNFGLVPPNTLSPNGAQTASPGTSVVYAHSYQAATGGQVTFSLASAANPAIPAWSQVLYLDSNCNASLEPGETPITAPVNLGAGQILCLIVKQQVPAGAPTGGQNIVTLNAAFSYTGAAPALGSALLATDSTTVGPSGGLTLGKLVNNVTQGGAAALSVTAKAGDTLQYTLTAINNGSQPISAVVISDATPAYTTYLSAACPGALPAGMTACSVSTQPAIGTQGGLQWSLSGSLTPGAQLSVTYLVKVNQ